MSNLFPKETKAEVQAKMQFNMYDAADVLQWNLVNGLEANGTAVSMINLLPVDSWPQYYGDACVKRHVFSHKAGALDVNVGFCNIKYIKRLLLKHAYAAEVRKTQQKGQSKGKDGVIAYSLNPPFIAAIKALKRKEPGIKAVAIVADLPEFSGVTGNLLRRIYRIASNKKIKKDLSVFDGFVLLTDQMAKKMEIQTPYMVMEGVAGEREVDIDQKQAEKTIFYSGSMNVQYGVTILLEAFAKIEDVDMKLVLCGLGDAEDFVQQHAKKDCRIQYLGKIPHAQALALQQSATVLVNPRQNVGEFTKYSFPSKTMEYLASGVPVVAYKLDGIPDEYGAHINYVPDNSPEALARELERICNLSIDERKTMGKAAQEFVLKEKNATVQTKRILEFMDNL